MSLLSNDDSNFFHLILSYIPLSVVTLQAYSALLYPLHDKTDTVTNDNSKIIALSMNLAFPIGIATKPIATIETKIIIVAH